MFIKVTIVKEKTSLLNLDKVFAIELHDDDIVYVLSIKKDGEMMEVPIQESLETIHNRIIEAEQKYPNHPTDEQIQAGQQAAALGSINA